MNSLTILGGPSLRDIQYDLRAWPGARSIREEYGPDTFAPTTLAHIEDWFRATPGGLPPDVRPLLRKAETEAWSRDDAEELFGVVAAALDQLAAEADIAPIEETLEKTTTTRLNRSKAVAKKNMERAQQKRDKWLAKWDALAGRGVPQRERAGRLALGGGVSARSIRNWVKQRVAKK